MSKSNVKLLPDEEIVFSHRAGYFPSAVPFSRGGRLVVTNRRVLFAPRKLDRTTGARDVSIKNPGITSVGSTPNAIKFGVPRKWLRIDTGDKSLLFLLSIYR